MTTPDEKIILGLDIPNTVRQINADLKKLQSQLNQVKTTASLDMRTTAKTLDSQITALQKQLAGIHAAVDLDLDTDAARIQKTGRQMGAGLAQEITESMEKEADKTAGRSFLHWLPKDSILSFLKKKAGEALEELKKADALLTKIGQADTALSHSQLAQIGETAYDTAGRYGKRAADYLAAAEKASRDGYTDITGIADLSLALQSAGGMTADLADRYIASTNEAYQLGGSVEKLSGILDGSSRIASRCAVSLDGMARGMSSVTPLAASLGMEARETSAALGVMMAATGQDGNEAADAFGRILLNLGQIEDAQKGIGTDSLARFGDACRSLNVPLAETQNGITALRDPMETIRDLADAYSSLAPGDAAKTALLDSLGSQEAAEALDALLGSYSRYEEMLAGYANGTGSLAAEAEKNAASWEGSLNRLCNTWDAVIANLASPEGIASALDGLNGLLSVLDNVTGALGPAGTAGAAAGLFASLKDVGSPKMYGLHQM